MWLMTHLATRAHDGGRRNENQRKEEKRKELIQSAAAPFGLSYQAEQQQQLAQIVHT